MNNFKKFLNVRTAAESIVLFAVFSALSAARIADAAPFGYALFLALCLAGGQAVIGSILLAVTGALVGWSLSALFSSISLAAFGFLLSFALSKLKIKKLLRMTLTLAFNLPYYGLILWLFGATPLMVILSVLFAFAAAWFLMFALPVLAGSRNIMTLSGAGLAALCFLLFVGFSPLKIGRFEVGLLLFGITVLFIGYIGGGWSAAAAGFLAALGQAMATGDITYLAILTASAILAAAFSRGYRVLSACGLIIGHVMCVYYFSVHYGEIVFSLAALGGAGLVYAAVPKKWMVALRDYFRPERVLTVVETSTAAGRMLAERVRFVGGAFGEIGNYLTNLGVGSGERKEGELLYARLKRYCEGCGKQSVCPLCAELTDGAGDGKYKRAGALSDAVLSVGCTYGSQIMKSANDLFGETAGTTAFAAAERRAVTAYGGRLQALSEMLAELTRAMTEECRFDRKLSAFLAAELHECGITAAETLVAETLSGIAVVADRVQSKSIEAALTRCLKSDIRIVDETKPAAGWRAVRFQREAGYSLVYAFSGVAKSGASGDTYSATVSNNRALLSLCDGRGSGSHAADLSATTLAVIEEYYKAGFGGMETVLCVNSLLAACIGEDFSALDVVSVDLTDCAVDIIKAGSPPTYIIKRDTVLRIDGSALPVGALEAARPALSRQLLSRGDIIVLISDGISDNLPALADFLSAQTTANMQKLADDILALALRNGTTDDMSVLVARITNGVN